MSKKCTCVLDKIIYNDFEISGYMCNSYFKRELREIFPNIIKQLDKNENSSSTKYLIILPTLQHAKYDLVRIGVEIEDEKDRLLNNFVNLSKEIQKKCASTDANTEQSTDSILWFDYIDPCSGHPMLTLDTGNTCYNEVDSIQRLMQYKVLQASCCRILTHPIWGTAVYPATMFVLIQLNRIHDSVDNVESDECRIQKMVAGIFQ